MKLSPRGKAFIQRFEGFRSEPYWDYAGFSVGYGHLIRAGEEYLMNGVTRAQAEDLFDKDVERFERAVNAGTTRPLSQPEFDSLVSWAYNVGEGRAAPGANQSDLMKLINKNAPLETIGRFWKSAYTTAGGVLNNGLVDRRKQEFDMFASGHKRLRWYEWAIIIASIGTIIYLVWRHLR